MLGIRVMTVEDLPVGMRLKEQAGWNQLESDWRRLLELQPDGCFLAELDGVGVGTVTTCRFGSVAWVAMMLVDEAFRSRGIGRALMVRALEELDSLGVRSVRLDATPRGVPMYESLGFVAETTLDRYRGILARGGRSTDESKPGSADRIEAIAALDREATGTDRERLIRRLVGEHRESLRVIERGQGAVGFLLSRPGSTARQIGPCIADERTGPILLDEALSRYAGDPVLLDVPSENAAASAIVGTWGLKVERVLLRMGRGPRVVEDLGRIWAGAGPEKG